MGSFGTTQGQMKLTKSLLLLRLFYCLRAKCTFILRKCVNIIHNLQCVCLDGIFNSLLMYNEINREMVLNR